MIAISLMAFVLLMLLSLSVLLQTEMAVSKSNQMNMVARQNALLGLNVAIGQLQELAGPDARATGSAQPLDDPAATPVTAAPASGHAHWTAVWSAEEMRAVDNPASSDGSVRLNSNADAYDDAKRKLKPLAWLVSGLDTSGNDPTPDQALADPVEMVGANTVTDVTVDGVEAGKVEVGDGAYAYWVADESTKARFDAIEPEALRTASAGSDEALSRVLATQGLGLQAMWLEDSAAARWSAGGYDVTSEASRDSLRRLGTEGPELPDADLVDALAANYHDVTFFSEGLLTNPVKGGLKKDLGVYLQTGAGLDDDDPVADLNRFPDLDPGGEHLVRWGRIRDWANLSTPLVPQVGDDETANVSPVIAFAGFDVGLSLLGAELSVHLWPEIVLWNPYDVPLRASDGYTVTYRLGPNSYLRLTDVEDVPSNGDTPQTYAPDTFGSESGIELQVGQLVAAKLGISSPNYTDWTTRVLLRFHLSDGGGGLTLDPGETMVFTLAGSSPLDGSLVEMIPGRVDPFENNPALSDTIYTFSPAPRDALDFTFTAIYFDWADVRLYPGQYTTSPVQSSWLQRLSYGSWGNQSSDLDATLDPLLGRSGAVRRDYSGRVALRPFSYHAGSVYPNWVPYSAQRGLAQYNFAAFDVPRVPAGGSSYSSGNIDGSAQTFTKEAGPYTFATGEFDFPLSQSDSTNSFTLWAMYGTTPNVASVNVSTQGSEYPILWRPSDASVLKSIGNLQHAPFSTHIWQPGYALGNAYADPLIARDHYSGLFDESGYFYQNPSNSTDAVSAANPPDNAHIDVSHVVNASVWDDYFLSGLPEQGGRLTLTSGQLDGTEPLPHARMNLVEWDDLGYADLASAQEQFDSGAAYLVQEGAFNVNSTSVNAWRALLGGALGVPVGGEDPGADAVYPRWPEASGGLIDTATLGSTPGSRAEAYNNAPRVSLADIDALAEAIVEEVRLRGPFTSLGDFVNRRLIAAADDPEDTGLRGALQAAIDRSGINDAFVDDGNTATYVSTDAVRSEQVIPEHIVAGEAKYSTMAGTPTFLTQADLLSALGASLTTRGDTFIIRAYGESRDPLTQEPAGQAWCEALVQREASYMDASDLPGIAADDLTVTENQNFGRRFRLVGFRWLSPDEI